MNYIELINRFWALNKEHSFTAYETQVYFKLLDTCNSLGWKNPFNQSNAYICGEICVSEPKLIGVRNKLKQVGLIDFVSGKVKREKTIYTILGLTVFSLNGSQSDSLNGSQSDSLNGSKRLDNIKHKLKKTKQELLLEKEAKANDPPENLPEFNFEKRLIEAGAEKSNVDQWLEIRKKKKAVNNEASLNLFFTELKKSGLKINEALEHCNANSWKGFRATWLTNSQNGTGQQGQGGAGTSFPTNRG